MKIIIIQLLQSSIEAEQVNELYTVDIITVSWFTGYKTNIMSILIIDYNIV